MNYPAALLGVALFILLMRALSRIRIFSTILSDFSFFKLQFFFFGIILALVFPVNFMSMFEDILGTIFLFCLSWIGLYYGCSLEIRELQKYSRKSYIFHIIEPLILLFLITVLGIVYVSIKFPDINHINIVLIAAFCSIALYKKSGISSREGYDAFRFLLNDLVPLRNIIGITALGIVFSLLFRTKELALFNHIFSGSITYFALNLMFGLAFGIIITMMISGASSTESLPIIVIGGTALIGGTVYMFSLSPLFVGTLTGAFIINARVKRLRTLETLTISNAHIEKVFMFCLGAYLVPMIRNDGLNITLLFAGAFGLFAVRSLLNYFMAYLWVSRFQGYNKDTTLLWIGLSGQGILAAGIALEIHMYVPELFFVFPLLIIVLILNQIATVLYLTKIS
ncbi:hypothetical protein ACFL1R_02045 [Candidatus Latescibacterota bacterium]